MTRLLKHSRTTTSDDPVREKEGKMKWLTAVVELRVGLLLVGALGLGLTLGPVLGDRCVAPLRALAVQALNAGALFAL